MPSTPFYQLFFVAPQLSSVFRKRGNAPTRVDLLKLAKTATCIATEEKACNTLKNAGFTCTPSVVQKLMSAYKSIWMTRAHQAQNIFLKRLGDAPQLSCRLPGLNHRTGRCYELAYRGCSQGNEWTVVHGEIGPLGIARMGHAWLENNGWVYDPVLDRTMRFDAYILLVGAVVYKRFTVSDMHNEAAKSGHYGPW